jgi:hypothetical protein
VGWYFGRGGLDYLGGVYCEYLFILIIVDALL